MAAPEAVKSSTDRSADSVPSGRSCRALPVGARLIAGSAARVLLASGSSVMVALTSPVCAPPTSSGPQAVVTVSSRAAHKDPAILLIPLAPGQGQHRARAP